jgi:hypothetical protein
MDPAGVVGKAIPPAYGIPYSLPQSLKLCRCQLPQPITTWKT